jgi:hypothetical protein
VKTSHTVGFSRSETKVNKPLNSSLLKVIISTVVLFLWNIVGNKLSDSLSLSDSAVLFIGTVLFLMIVWIEMGFQTPRISSGFTERIKPSMKYILIAITVVISIVNLYSLRYGIGSLGFMISSIFLYSIFGVFMINAGIQLSKRSDTVRWFSIWYFVLGAVCFSIVALFIYEAFV